LHQEVFAMPRLLRGVVIAAVLAASAGPAQAWGRRAQTTAYYYPASVICVPVYPSAGVMAPVPYLPALAPASSAPVYATPTPAPPQGTLPGTAPVPPGPMPPAGTPGVRESSSYYDAYAATATSSLPAAREGRANLLNERSSVGFWNSTPRDMVLRVNGAAYRLTAGKGMTLDLPRRFTWQIDERAARAEELNEAAIDIVIRR
jgi:hypothetical protein